MITEELNRFRGDTQPYKIQLVDENNNPKDIKDHSFILTASNKRNPSSDDSPLFTVPGVITKADEGKVVFPFDSQDVELEINDPPRIVFFDVEQTNKDGFTKTVVKGVFRFFQDISK